MRGVRKSRYREATRTLQSGVPDNLRGCWSGLYPESYKSKYQRSCFSQGNGVIWGFSAFGCAASTGSRATSADELFTSAVLVNYASERSAPNDCCELLFPSTKCGDKSLRTRRELATAPAWVLSRGTEMAKTENRKP